MLGSPDATGAGEAAILQRAVCEHLKCLSKVDLPRPLIGVADECQSGGFGRYNTSPLMSVAGRATEFNATATTATSSESACRRRRIGPPQLRSSISIRH